MAEQHDAQESDDVQTVESEDENVKLGQLFRQPYSDAERAQIRLMWRFLFMALGIIIVMSVILAGVTRIF
jgi:hypothetical protein